jgi:hypothetical protein
MYLRALSICDFCTCIFVIINLLEYLTPPPLINSDSVSETKFRWFYLLISIYISPITLTFQNLSCWLVCALSIHRCLFITKSFNKFNTKILKKKTSNTNNDDDSVLEFPIEITKKKRKKEKKFNEEAINLKSIPIIVYEENESKGLSVKYDSIENLQRDNSIQSKTSIKIERELITTNSNVSTNQNTLKLNPSVNGFKISNKNQKTLKSNKKVALNIILSLYILSFILCIPQMFEKYIAVETIPLISKIYLFSKYTDFGNTMFYR